MVAGGEVNNAILPDLIRRARSLGFCDVNGELVGVGAIKHPMRSYRQRIAASAGIADFEIPEVELGWVYVDPRFRNLGIARHLLTDLLATVEQMPVYATSRLGNAGMQACLNHLAFRPLGGHYPSKQSADRIQLFVRSI